MGTEKPLFQHDRTTNLWLVVNFMVHLRAVEGEQTHPVPFPQQVLLAISHVEGFFLHYLSGDEGGSSESECLFQGTVWERAEREVVRN